jgi:DNA gyrase inhibitor GyrI
MSLAWKQVFGSLLQTSPYVANYKPSLMSFVSRQIPPDVQSDRAIAEDTRGKKEGKWYHQYEYQK